jgi:hypothetical protein
MKTTTLNESMLAFSKAIDHLIDVGAPLTPDVAEVLRTHWLDGNNFLYENSNKFQTHKELHAAAYAQAQTEIANFRAAQIPVTEAAAAVLLHWFVSGAVWAWDNRFLEKEKRILTRH